MAAIFKVNEHIIERIARIALGIVLLGFAFVGGYWWGFLGFVPLLTGATGFCPLYRVFGLNTCGKEECT